MNFQSEIDRTSYNEADHLISALNKYIQSFEKQLDEKQIIIETLIQTFLNCCYNNKVANSNHKADKVSFENFNSSYEKHKIISNKSNQVDEDDNQNNNDNQRTISETKGEQSMTLDKRNDKSSRTPKGDKIPEKETKEQIINSSCHHSDKENDVTPAAKTKKKTVVIVGDSIVQNVPNRSLNQSLKEYFSIIKSFPGAATQDILISFDIKLILDHLSSEKQLDEKQIVIETLLQNIQNCSYNNILANSNHRVDKVSFENFNSSYEKSKMISNKSNQEKFIKIY